jgi:GT2 family glycosyltransferase
VQNDRVLKLPFDLYERYLLTQRLVGALWPDRKEGLRILDVGGHSSPLKYLLPHHTVVIADVEPPGSFTALPARFDGYVEASGARLPVADRSFDLVAAHDTLEHVPPHERLPFVRELLRVAGRFVLLNGPIRRPHVEWAEARLSAFLESVLGERSRFLAEHEELGLPSPEDIEAMLGPVPFVRIPNGNAALWLSMNVARSYVRTLPDSVSVVESVDQTFNSLYADRDLAEPCYREAFLVAADASDAPRLAEAHQGLMSDRQGRSTVAPRAVDPLVAVLEKHGEQVHGLVAITHELRRMEAQLAEAESRIEQIQMSIVYRFASRTRKWVDRAAPWGTRRRSLFHYVVESLRVVADQGWGPFFRRLANVRRWGPRILSKGLPLGATLPINEQYQLWLRRHAPSPEALAQMARDSETFGYRPRISILMPVYNTEPSWLRAAVDSVRRQVYGEWELCIADDGSTRTDANQVLGELDGGDPRIRVMRLERNEGIAAGSNAALRMATGEFVGLLDHDDELKPNALFEVVRLLNDHRDLDYVYTDEDKRDPDGRLVDPFFKPDWSPDLLRSVNYVTHFSVFRKELVDRVGGFRLGYEGSQDYDLVLRVVEHTDRIAHIALPLYTWRKAAGSTAASDDAKPFAYEAAKRALTDSLARRRVQGEVMDGPRRGYYRIRYTIRGSPNVSIIIPTRDKVDLLARCIESVERKSTYRNFELLVVDNDSHDPRTIEYLSALKGKVVAFAHDFNFSRIVNFATGYVDSPYILFLNNDTEVIAPDWIEAMLEHAQRPEVAAVGARLLYLDRRPQHEGILVGPRDGLAGNLDHRGYFALGESIRNCSAVTAACMMTRRSVFLELGGFEEQMRVAYNDVDFCLRAGEKGYLTVLTPYALLYHHEGGTRGRTGKTHPTEDERFFRDRWAGYRDPYYNPNFDIDHPFNLSL